MHSDARFPANAKAKLTESPIIMKRVHSLQKTEHVVMESLSTLLVGNKPRRALRLSILVAARACALFRYDSRTAKAN